MISYRIDPSEKYSALSFSLSGLVFEISTYYVHPIFLRNFFYSCKTIKVA